MQVMTFGASGQDGHYVERLIRRLGGTPIGVGRTKGDAVCDVADGVAVRELIGRLKPDFVFHFAADSTTSHNALRDNHASISTGTLNILEAARLECPDARIFLAGSALQFQNAGKPINETCPFEASSPYALSRVHSTYAGRYYRAAFGLRVYTGFLFHHDSPLRSERHVSQKIAQAALRIACGSAEVVTLGDIDVQKEFNFAGDVVDAMWCMLNQDQVFEAVIGCGEVHSIREWLDYCFGKVGKRWQDHVNVDPCFPVPFKCLASDPARIKSLGWRPTTSFGGLADMMMA